MFPPTCAAMPHSRRMCPVSAVVVVFPFDPVMPAMSPFRNQLASSRSPTTRSPFSRSKSAGTPGDKTTSSAPSKDGAVWGRMGIPNSLSRTFEVAF